MKYFNKNKMYAFLVVLSLFISCDEETDLSPRSVVSQGSFWQSEDDAEAGLFGVYNQLRSEAAGNLTKWGEARSDLWVNRGMNGTAGVAEYIFNTIDAQTPGATWNGLYTMIHRTNLVLAQVPEIDFADESKKNYILAEAYAHRAFAYFVIARTWGDAPIRTEPTDGDALAAQMERSSKEAVISQVKSDIELSLSLFKDDSFKSKYRWSKSSVNTLKGDVFLWSATVMGGGQGDFSTALSALNAVTGVSLMSTFDDIFDIDENSEILLSIPNGEIEGVNTFSSNSFLQQIQWQESIGDPAFFAQVEEKLGGITRYEPSDYAILVYEDGDLRRAATQLDFIWDGILANPQTPDGLFINPVREPNHPNLNNDKLQSCLGWKFAGFLNSSGTARIFRDDIPIYRYGEVLLLIAEAKIGLGQDPSTEINMVRERAFGAGYNPAIHGYVYNSGTAIDDLLDERLRELQLEGKRWWSLIKYDKVFEMVPELIGRQGNANVSIYWPLTDDHRNRNPLLIQTEGYDPF